MNTRFVIQASNRYGSALLMTLIMGAVALTILASAMAWSATSTRLTHRSIQYDRSIVAAEAATEKVISQITRDFLYGSENLVISHLNNYRQNTVPSATDSAYWNSWEFNDGNGNTNQTYVQREAFASYAAMDPIYAGLRGFISTYTVVSHARDTASIQNVIGGVFQQVQLASIPIFQFAMYSSEDMEISCGQPFDVTGRVHSNRILYVEPDSFLTFESGVTAVVSNLFQRDPLDTRGSPSGGVVYAHPEQVVSPVAALTLPIGTTNTPDAVREIIAPPPTGEDPTSPIGRMRYYNSCDMLLVVSDTGVRATSGSFNNFATPVPTNELSLFVSTAGSFWDARESKTVLPVDVNIASLTTWSQTNSSLRLSLLGSNLNSVYILDNRTLPANNLRAVRVNNGAQLPPNGLTIATARPLYVLGDYNQFNPANLGTTNTSTTRPASLVADAITILSDNWSDANSASPVGSRVAADTTVNAAFLTGVVPTTAGHYSGGMENFPRFLETWGLANVFTYNGSMVNMFPSRYATNVWGMGNVYSPPARNWAFDVNFDDPTKLPPKTPSLLKVIRSKWAAVAPGQNAIP